MTYTSPEKKILPATGDLYAYTDEQKAFAASIRDVVPVANRAEADSIVTAMNVDGRPVSDANILVVFNNQLKNLEICDSSGWRPMMSTAPMGHVGVTSGFQTIGAGLQVNFTSAQILRGGVTFSDAQDALIVPYTGLYRFSFRAYCTGGSSSYSNQCRLRKNTANTGIYAFSYKPDAYDYTNSVSGILPLAAGDAMSLWMELSGTNASAATWGTDGYNGTYLEMEMIGT